MSIAAGALKMGRAMARQMMDDTVRVYRLGDPVWDEAAGDYVTSEVEVYAGPARTRVPRAFGNRVDEQGDAVTVQEATLSLPVEGSAGVVVDDLVEVTSSTYDPDMVGLVLRVAQVHWQSHSTARRFGVEVES